MAKKFTLEQHVARVDHLLGTIKTVASSFQINPDKPFRPQIRELHMILLPTYRVIEEHIYQITQLLPRCDRQVMRYDRMYDAIVRKREYAEATERLQETQGSGMLGLLDLATLIT